MFWFVVIVGFILYALFVYPKSQGYKSGKDRTHPEKCLKIFQNAKSFKQLYCDKGGRYDKSFKSYKYKIAAKPDYLYEIDGELYLIEYKARRGKVKYTDRMQVYAAALAVRREYPSLRKAIIYTLVEYREIALFDDWQLYNEIKDYHTVVGNIKNGFEPMVDTASSPCANCGYRQSCRA